MSKDSILKVKETEAQAEQIVLEARAKAQKMLEDAEREGKALCSDAELEMLAKRDEMMALVRERSEQIGATSLEEAKQEANDIKREASLRRKVAEKIIIRGLDSKCR